MLILRVGIDSKYSLLDGKSEISIIISVNCKAEEIICVHIHHKKIRLTFSDFYDSLDHEQFWLLLVTKTSA
jgi:hypothetical protein